MHRHGYKGRKFGRKRDQREALMSGLLVNLFNNAENGIKTTLPKAKELRRPAEKLITKAKKGDLANRRAVISALKNDVATGHLLVDKIAPQVQRNSGYLKIVKIDEPRRGDNAPMARVEFVDKISFEDPKKKVVEKEVKTAPKTTVAKTEKKENK